MKIERLLEPQHPGGQFTVFLEDGKKLRLQPAVVGDFGLYTGLDLDDDLLARLREANAAASARARAVRIISSASVSEKDLRRRLVQKGEKEADADGAVEWLRDLDLLDDRETARQLAQSAARKGYGPARIRQVLYQKGIDRSLWDEAMEDLPSPDGAIDSFLASRFRGRKPEQTEVKRAVDALLRRGHRWNDIKPAIQRYTDALDDVTEEF